MLDELTHATRNSNLLDSFDAEERDLAINGLRKKSPKLSAARILSPTQRNSLILLAIGLAGISIAAPATTFIALNIFFAAYFLIAIAYRIFLMAVGRNAQIAGNSPAIPKANSSLPEITILAPLYKDAASLHGLSEAIDALDYPEEKKDVKLLLEANDAATIAEAKRLKLSDRYDVIIVPNEGPRTKPKACNFGLLRAHGELIVIYDAEDQPEKDQLLKAADAFAANDGALACVQARLSYYNIRENWLTRLFTLEYAMWFDWLLPALQKLNAPIPLGGTSNFFRTDILRKVGGWDPFNVTEDADLGLRLAKLGYRVEMLDSTTFEEANCDLGNWIRQRSRWIKGHLQTWLVHMRDPRPFITNNGWHGLLSVQLFLAGNVLSALFNPLLWVVFLLVNVFGVFSLNATTPGALPIFNLSVLIIGNLAFAACAAIAPLKRGWRDLCLFGLTAPVYWILTSIAAYKALWQIFYRPYYWEKTDHMISTMAPQRAVKLSPQLETQ